MTAPTHTTSTRRTARSRAAAIAGTTLLAGLLAAPAVAAPAEVTFEVTVHNVSTLGQLDTDRAGGQIPLSPPVYAVHRGAEVLFAVGEEASPGLEDVAEDGTVAVLLDELSSDPRVSDAGAAFGPAGPVLAGESTTFEVTARRGDRLSLATMFVQSNDYFFADDGEGIRLFERGEPISGDVTAALDLWDAGTEQDFTPGTGPFQVLAQGGALDVGPDEGGVIGLASDDGFELPADEDVIRVTIEPIG